MNIVVSVLSRATVDQPFAEVVAPVTLTLTGDQLAYTPPVPANAIGQELRLRVRSDDGITVAIGAALDPATRPAPKPRLDDNGVQIGIEPSPTPTVLKRIGVWGGQSRDVPVEARETVIFARNGAPITLV